MILNILYYIKKMFIVYKMEHFNYIGSTHDLKHRQRNHIKNCYNKNIKHYNFKVYKNIRKKTVK